MRPNFAAVMTGEVAFADLTRPLDLAQLRALTIDYYDEFATLLADLTDEQIAVVPFDPALKDQQESEGAWTLAHVVAHFTASQEESAARSSNLARGVELPEGTRLRYETPWESLTTAEQVRQRLAESRRLSLAFLDTWPDVPNLDLNVNFIPFLGPLNAVGSYALGLLHTDTHLGQVREIVRQLREQAAQ